jgi:Cdc6-like AAA superfamily ATPase
MDEQEYYQFLAQVTTAFTPDAPIDSRDLFAGRKPQREKVMTTIFQKGAHAVLYGERGVGKTSLANILFDILVFMGKFNFVRARVNCADGMSFDAIWQSIFRQMTFTQSDGQTLTLDLALPENPNSENVRETFQLHDSPSIIVIDEFDRIKDANTKVMMADTIKTLSDNAIDTTLILVGVAESVDQLIGKHPSIERNIKQVVLQSMSKAELLEIVNKGLSKCPGITIDDQVRDRIADYSQGLPSTTHLLARESAINAVRLGRTNIAMEDLDAAIREATENQGGTNLTLYNKAVTAPRGKYFKPVLLACALAQKDEKGFFYANNVTEPLRLITGIDYKIPAFAQHLKDFSDTRGPILEKDGRRYRFINPLMRPYVILKGLADGLIQESQLSRPSSTSTEPEQLSLLYPASAPQIELEP